MTEKKGPSVTTRMAVMKADILELLGAVSQLKREVIHLHAMV